MEEKTYVCRACGTKYESGWSHEEALAEFGEDYPGHDLEDAVIVCDDCYKLLTGMGE